MYWFAVVIRHKPWLWLRHHRSGLPIGDGIASYQNISTLAERSCREARSFAALIAHSLSLVGEIWSSTYRCPLVLHHPLAITPDITRYNCFRRSIEYSQEVNQLQFNALTLWNHKSWICSSNHSQSSLPISGSCASALGLPIRAHGIRY
jgi:hypothetical protein